MSNLYLDSSFENAYHDVKLVFDLITDDDTFQSADSGLVFSYLDRIVEALEKQVPKKITDCACPICNSVAVEITSDGFMNPNEPFEYCCYCGQKLDWSDDKCV
jgi:hypothetical protein